MNDDGGPVVLTVAVIAIIMFIMGAIVGALVVLL